jgi:hypothetical protein
VEFESPQRGCREPSGSCQRYSGHPGRASPSGHAGSRRRQAQASSFVLAVPPTCHKRGPERYLADSHGHFERAVMLGTCR